MLSLEMKIEDALFRIKDLYDRTNGKCIISFSGGKDSTVVAELYLIAKEKGLVNHIPLVFADTKVEFAAIYDFVKWYGENKQKVEYIKPKKPFSQVLKEYGKPAMSKVKSDFLSTYQNSLQKNKNPLLGSRTGELITGFRTGANYEIRLDTNMKPMPTRQKLANKHFNFIHPQHEYKISAKCCDFLKKQPFEKYYEDNSIRGYATGMRIAEGGIRSEMYKSCTAYKTIRIEGKKQRIVHKMPLFDWTDEDVDMFIETHDIKISEAYTKYGLARTGCIGCPFAKDIENNLKVLYEYEPKKYKAVQHWLGDVYLDLEIEIPFDKTYTNKLKSRKPIIQQRRYEMMKKYRSEWAYKWKPKETQISIFDMEVKNE